MLSEKLQEKAAKIREFNRQLRDRQSIINTQMIATLNDLTNVREAMDYHMKQIAYLTLLLPPEIQRSFAETFFNLTCDISNCEFNMQQFMEDLEKTITVLKA